MPSATQFPAISFKYGITDAVNRDPSELLAAITALMVESLRTLAASGVSYLQIDAPIQLLPRSEVDCVMEEELRVDPAEMLTASLDADNACFAAARHAGVTMAVHLCRGNNRSH